jgi:hypothetical protein
MNKKNYPLAVLKEMTAEIEPVIRSKQAIAHRVKNDDVLYHIVDNELGSGFYFNITKHTVNQSRIQYFIEYRPCSALDLVSMKEWVDLKGLLEKFNTWTEIVRGYDNVSSIYEDPIIKSYRVEYEEMFKIVDEDADIAPFNLEQQKYLDGYLSKAIEEIKLATEGKSGGEKEELKIIENDLVQLKNELTKETKGRFIQKLSKILAQARKVSFELATKITVELIAEITVRALFGSK